ncbi:MAG: hypothetical protein IH614_00680 [Desulfuromonadales bacterium]|nr:hypothetical protein [Desulfuromonadales bacterium]
MAAETFSCPNCRTPIEASDVENTVMAVCPQCGNGYRVAFDPLVESYQLQAEEPPEFPTDIDTDRV